MTAPVTTARRRPPPRVVVRDTAILTAAARFPTGHWFTIRDVHRAATGYDNGPWYFPIARMLLGLYKDGNLERDPPLHDRHRHGHVPVCYRWTED